MNISSKVALLFCVILICFLPKNSSGQNSNLAEGEIYKLAIPKTGVYKITTSFVSSNFNIAANQIDPNQIQIFTDQGGMLPEPIEQTENFDPVEIPIYISGTEDGTFNGSDEIYFFAYGPEHFNWNKQIPEKEVNIYDNNQYVYIKFNTANGKRLTSKSSVGGTASFKLNSSFRIHRHEIDRKNLLADFNAAQGSGKNWYGESFANNWVQNFSSNFVDMDPIPGTDVFFSSSFAARSDNSSTVIYTLGNSEIDETISWTNTGNVEADYARIKNTDEIINIGSSPNVSIEFIPNQQTDNGWLDFIQFITEETLDFTNQDLIFHIDAIDNEFIGLPVSDLPQGTSLWDVTNFSNISSLSSAGLDEFVFEVGATTPRFIAFNEANNYPSPSFIQSVNNQDLKSHDSPDMIILYHKDFEDAAMMLSAHRSAVDELKIQAVDVDQVFNEFGSGKKDPTAIRNFAKYHYDFNKSFQYLLLLGDATFDYRHLNEDDPDNNFIPTFETDESLDPIRAFPTDDYYILLSDNEGGNLEGAVDIAIGRIPVKTAEEANAVVEKIIHYDTNSSTLNSWKLNVGFTADDEDSDVHFSQANGIANNTASENQLFNQQKVFFDAFVQESTPGGSRYPSANAKINENIFAGQLILCYLGHGGPKGWAQERVLQINDIKNWDNLDKMPVIVTATCSFTGFDDPNFVTAGEEAILNPNGGSVALFTTVRAVFSHENARLTQAVFDNMFTQEGGKYLRLGEIMRRAKNANSQDTTSSNSRKFALIGDPSMRLGAPEHKVVIDEINNSEVNSEIPDTLKALDRVTLGGHIETQLGSNLSGFNGKVFITVFDKATEAKTLGNDSGSSVRSFSTQNNILFKGAASVINGEFSLEFVMPKEINFNFGIGKISMYASDDVSQDAGGFYENIIIGGSNDASVDDNIGPEIKIFMNDENFASGGITDTDPILLVNLSDELGINISSTSIGHDINGILDDDTANPLKLNDFYQATVDDFSSGTVNFPLRNLEPGLHKIKIKAWDICNNSSEKELEFRVVDRDNTTLEHVLNYPNPFTTNTSFTFEHQLAGGQLDILVSVYTLSGKLVKTIEHSTFATGFRVDDINWNGRDDFGERLGKGIYLYKIKIKDNSAELQLESDFEKLVILK